MTSCSPLNRVYGIFFRCSKAANSVVHGRIRSNFELIRLKPVSVLTSPVVKTALLNRPINSSSHGKIVQELFKNSSRTSSRTSS